MFRNARLKTTDVSFCVMFFHIMSQFIRINVFTYLRMSISGGEIKVYFSRES